MSLIPIRCYTCNKVIANKWEPYVEKLAEGLTENEALEKLGIKRYCCKRMIISHVDMIESLLNYSVVKKEKE
jgi:DNA-directed RNA polymerase I, II, and III subunit RPABC5